MITCSTCKSAAAAAQFVFVLKIKSAAVAAQFVFVLKIKIKRAWL